MKITVEMLHQPSWFEIIMFTSARLVGEARTRFVEKVGEHNLYLAVKCKRASIEPEQALVEQLQRKAIEKARRIDEPKIAAEGMLALAELRNEKKLLEIVINTEFEKLFAIYQAIEDFNIKPPLLLSTLLAFKSPRQFYELFTLELEDNGRQLGEYVYSKGSYRVADFSRIIELVRKLQEEGMVLNVIAYNTLINHSDDFTTAKTFFEEMKQQGLKPNEKSYSMLMNKSDDFATARAYFEEMKQLGLTPDQILYNTLLHKAQRAPFIEILKLLEAMQAAGLKPQSKFDKRQKRYRNYTLEAVQPTIKKNRKLFTDWAKTKGSHDSEWQEFYAELLKN